MKASLLKRIASLESHVNLTRRPPVILFDVTGLDPDAQDEYWSTDQVDPEAKSLGYIHTIIIDVHELCRVDYREMSGLDDDDLEEHVEREERELRRQKAAERAALLPPVVEEKLPGVWMIR